VALNATEVTEILGILSSEFGLDNAVHMGRNSHYFGVDTGDFYLCIHVAREVDWTCFSEPVPNASMTFDEFLAESAKIIEEHQKLGE
jgi:hypothetical protein